MAHVAAAAPHPHLSPVSCLSLRNSSRSTTTATCAATAATATAAAATGGSGSLGPHCLVASWREAASFHTPLFALPLPPPQHTPKECGESPLCAPSRRRGSTPLPRGSVSASAVVLGTLQAAASAGAASVGAASAATSSACPRWPPRRAATGCAVDARLAPGRTRPPLQRLAPSSSRRPAPCSAMASSSSSDTPTAAEAEAPRAVAAGGAEGVAAPCSSPPALEQSKTLKRYGILLTGHFAGGTREKYGGYDDMFVRFLAHSKANTDAKAESKTAAAGAGGEGGESSVACSSADADAENDEDVVEEWSVFRVVDGQFPTPRQLDQLDGLVVTGSKFDAHGPEEWIERTCELLRTAHAKRKRILSVCFGHQVLSRALGGRTGRASVGWEIGLKQLKPTPALLSFPHASCLPRDRPIRILEIHQDQVQELPPGAVLLASSAATAVEMFAVGDTALGIQGHPEFAKEVVEDLVTTRVELGIIPEEVGAEALQSMARYDPDEAALRHFCISFLKGLERPHGDSAAHAPEPM